MEWFRRKTWTDHDRDEFLTRLKRCRGQFHKAQYARIQAVELLEEPTEANLRGAMELLKLVLEYYPEPSQIAPAYEHLGDCYAILGCDSDALVSYRNALHQQRIFPQVRTNAHLAFALIVAECRRQADYDEALAVLSEFGDSAGFPITEFRTCTARALIHSDRGDRRQATDWARRALVAAARTESDFRYHRKLGLVGPNDNDRIKQMRTILESD